MESTETKPHPESVIACQQVLLEDAAVFSIQWMVMPAVHASRLTPDALLESYLAHIRRFTLGLIRPARTETGIEFRLLGSTCALLRFTPPLSQGDGALTLAICGGVLVQRDQCRRGELAFLAEPTPDGIKVILRLSDYCPLLLGSRSPSPLRKWLYRMTQASIHKLVTIRFLSRLYRELTGNRSVQVVKIRVQNGEEI
ncbi:MAG: hypothetical protein CXR31_13425 [Geobacter sp.]|nr:MAG: hypothetical protein CXR31_13425 [Geobacter sp.]